MSPKVHGGNKAHPVEPVSDGSLYEELRRHRNLLFDPACYYANGVLAEFARLRPTTRSAILAIDPSPDKYARFGRDFIHLIRRHLDGQKCDYPGWGERGTSISSPSPPSWTSSVPLNQSTRSTGGTQTVFEPEIVADGLTKKVVDRWRSMLTVVCSSLPIDECQVVPPFCLYRTLLKAMNETFDCNAKRFDEAAEEYMRGKVWAFAYMDGEGLRNNRISATKYRRVVLMVDRVGMVEETVPVEFTVFHEIGHFVIRFIRNVVLTKRNEMQVEYAADEYAFHAYARLLHKCPDYCTAFPTQKQLACEAFMKTKVANFIEKADGMAGEKMYAEIARLLLKELKWQDMYRRNARAQGMAV